MGLLRHGLRSPFTSPLTFHFNNPRSGDPSTLRNNPDLRPFLLVDLAAFVVQRVFLLKTLNEEDGRTQSKGIGRRGQREAGLERDGEPKEVNHIRKENKFKNPSSLEVCSGNERENEGSRSPGDRKDDYQISRIEAVIRDIFGDDEEQADYTDQNQIEDKEKNALVDEERNFQKELLDGVPYKPEKEYAEAEQKENAGLSPVLEIPVHHPLADPYKMHLIKLSNIVGIEPKPFDPNTYVAQDFFTTDKSGARRRILPNNIVRWRNVKNPDGTTTVESNSRFVIWDDGSLQLLIGEESFDVYEQDMHDMQTHLFSVHDKEILQCEGRIRKKMHFMPSSLTSDPHRTLSALIDARDKKAIKVRSCIAEIDPEWEIKNKMKAETKMKKADKQLGRKKGKVIHKHKQTVNREKHHLPPNILEDANDKKTNQDFHQLQLSASRCQFEGNLENKAGTEIRHFDAKKASHLVMPSPPLQGGTFQVPKHFPRFVFSAASSSQQPIDFFGSKEKESSYNYEGKEYDGSSSDRRSRETKQNCEEEDNETSGDKSVVNDNFSKSTFFSSV